MNLYDSLFVGFHNLVSRTSYKDIATFTSLVALTWLSSMSVNIILGWLGVSVRELLPQFGDFVFGVVALLPFFLINYFYFLHKSRFKVLLDASRSQEGAKRVNRELVAILISILVLVLGLI